MQKIILVLFLVASLVLNIWFYKNSEKQPVSEKQIPSFAELEKQYPLLSKRALRDFPSDLLINFRALRLDLRNTVEPWGDTFGFYFEYLPTGTTIGVKEKDQFTAASLLKVPIVMSYFHQQERLGLDDDKEVVIEEVDINKQFGNLWKRGVGTRVRMSEAIKLALTESDNTAVNVISRQVDEDDFAAVNEGLDIEIQQEKDTPIITLKQYSSILKAVFFGSIVSREHSQEILDYLSMSTFSDKLPAGVDKEITVAHKVGVLDGKLYTDCGIVYIPLRPYLLCMASASSEEVARERMITVSRKAFSFVLGIK